MRNKGQILVIAIVFLTVILLTSLTLYSLVAFFARNAQLGLSKEQALHLAEAGVEKAVWSLNFHGESYTGEQATPLGPGEFSVTLNNLGLYSKEVVATGFVPSVEKTVAKKTVKVKVGLGTQEIAFRYAAHIGEGGLDMKSNAEVTGNVHSNGNITGASNTQITGDAHAVGTISSPTPQVTGEKKTGVDPIPFTEIDLEYWKSQANENNDPIIGDYTISTTGDFGPRKIQGNLTISGNNTKVTVKGPVHVTGNFTMNSNTELILDPAFGSLGTVILVEGQITLNSNVKIWPTTASPKGYILLISTATGEAIELNSDILGGIFISTQGTTTLNSNVDIVAVTAYKLVLESNASLVYDVGLAGSQFSSGSGGSWEIVKSSYQIIP